MKRLRTTAAGALAAGLLALTAQPALAWRPRVHVEASCTTATVTVSNAEDTAMHVDATSPATALVGRDVPAHGSLAATLAVPGGAERVRVTVTGSWAGHEQGVVGTGTGRVPDGCAPPEATAPPVTAAPAPTLPTPAGPPATTPRPVPLPTTSPGRPRVRLHPPASVGAPEAPRPVHRKARPGHTLTPTDFRPTDDLPLPFAG